MMPMKKITFNAPLNHKAYSYEPMQIEVEKVIPLYGKMFEQMRDHPLEDAPEIIENRDLMYRLCVKSSPEKFQKAQYGVPRGLFVLSELLPLGVNPVQA